MASTARSELETLASGAVAGDLLAIPLGATEQHGPHLPLGTDTLIATALAATLDCAVAPALPYGSSGEHAGFPGTLSIGQDALEAVLVELARSASFERVLFVSAHGGNAEPLARAVARLRSEGRAVAAWSPRWEGDAHAGRVETSLMLALAPELVGPARVAGNVEPLATLLPRLRREGVRAVAPNGVLGDPAGASAEEGRALWAAARADLRAFVEETMPGGAARPDNGPAGRDAGATAPRGRA